MKNFLSLIKSKISTQNNFLDELISNIPIEIKNHLWFLDGKLKNCDIKKGDTFKAYGIEFCISFQPTIEPSAISIKYPVGVPITPAPRLPYFPSYLEMTPDEKATYLNWLSHIDEPIDIGYVFVFYYGLEKFLYFGGEKSFSAFNLILRLRKHHKNASFLHYSLNALYGASIVKQQDEWLENILKIDKNSTSIIHLACMANFCKPLLPCQIIDLSSSVGFTNKRYIKIEPDLFYKTLETNLLNKYSMPAFPLNKQFLKNCQKTTYPIAANITFDPRWISIPNILTNEKVKAEIFSILQTTHNDVKALLRTKRKK